MFSGYATNKSNIEEANKHLQALMERISVLEETCREQSEILTTKDDQMKMQLLAFEEEKNREIKILQTQLRQADLEIDSLTESSRQKDMIIANLRQSASILSDVMKYKPVFEKLSYQLGLAEHLNLNSQLLHNGNSQTLDTNHSPVSTQSGIDESVPSSQFHSSSTSKYHSKQIKKTSAPLKQKLATNLLSGTNFSMTSDNEDDMNSRHVFNAKELYL